MVEKTNYKTNLRNKWSCEDCTNYSKRNGCKCDLCPYIIERIQAGKLDYEQLLNETICVQFQKYPMVIKRLEILPTIYENDLFLDDSHRSRFYITLHKVKTSYGSPNLQYLAALYLLTARKQLWQIVENEVYAKKIYFENVKLRDINTECYTYYQMARMLFDDVPRITIYELTDRKLIPDTVFKTLNHGALIKLYGIEVLSI